MRINVTDLESYRYWVDSEDSTVDELLIRLAHVDAPTRKMQAGRAFAKYMETASVGDMVDAAKSDGWEFHFDCYAKIRKPVVHEMKVERDIQTPYGLVTLVGKVDMFSGLVVSDQKLVEQFDVEGKFTDSLQWRCYLWMLQAQVFEYDIFVGKVDDESNEVVIRDYHMVRFYTFPAIEDKVMAAVNKVASIIQTHGERIRTLREGRALQS